MNGLLDQIRSSLLELELGTFDWIGMAVGLADGKMDGTGVDFDRLRGDDSWRFWLVNFLFGVFFFSVHEAVDCR